MAIDESCFCRLHAPEAKSAVAIVEPLISEARPTVQIMRSMPAFEAERVSLSSPQCRFSPTC
jgi:hypothetical protein